MQAYRWSTQSSGKLGIYGDHQARIRCKQVSGSVNSLTMTPSGSFVRWFPGALRKTFWLSKKILVRPLSSKSCAESNREGRLELATLYRALCRENLHEGVCNHASLIVPAAEGGEDVMLLVAYGTHWSRATASGLLALNKENKVVEGRGKAEITAACIHRAVHDVRDDAKCVIHVHSPYAAALGMIKNVGLEMVHQNSCRFYNDVAYDDSYNGLATDMGEGERIAQKMRNKNILMMRNHGVMVTGSTVPVAFDRMYFFERACQVQLLAMTSGKELITIPDAVAASTHAVFQQDIEGDSADHFNAIRDCIIGPTQHVDE